MYSMAINNPYAAYQRYATVNKPRISSNQTRQEISPNTDEQEVKTTISNNVHNFSGNSVNQYFENTVLTAAPEELTLMLYDGAIKFMNKAIIFIEMKDVEKAHHSILRAQDIFAELMSTLNMDYEISKNLYNLYDFINVSLIQANINKDSELLREAINLTRELRDTWAQAMKLAKKG